MASPEIIFRSPDVQFYPKHRVKTKKKVFTPSDVFSKVITWNCYSRVTVKLMSTLEKIFHTFFPLLVFVPALGVSVKSVYLVAGRLGFYSQSGHTKDFKNSIRTFRAKRSAQAEVRRVLCMCCSSCMSLNSVQSFVIENYNGPTI